MKPMSGLLQLDVRLLRQHHPGRWHGHPDPGSERPRSRVWAMRRRRARQERRGRTAPRASACTRRRALPRLPRRPGRAEGRAAGRRNPAGGIRRRADRDASADGRSSSIAATCIPIVPAGAACLVQRERHAAGACLLRAATARPASPSTRSSTSSRITSRSARPARAPGIIGSAVIRGRATEILDVAHFLPLAYPDWFDDEGAQDSRRARAACCWSTARLSSGACCCRCSRRPATMWWPWPRSRRALTLAAPGRPVRRHRRRHRGARAAMASISPEALQGDRHLEHVPVIGLASQGAARRHRARPQRSACPTWSLKFDRRGAASKPSPRPWKAGSWRHEPASRATRPGRRAPVRHAWTTSP